MIIDKAILLDKILQKFAGNITVKWSDLQTGLWDDIATYDDCEKNINFLVGDGMLKRNTNPDSLSTTDKGFATMTDLENLGYVVKAKKERRETIIKYIGFGIGVATFILLCFKTFIPQLFSQSSDNQNKKTKNKQMLESPVREKKTKLPNVNNTLFTIDTATLSPKSVTLTKQIVK
jgi:hypothetical protein